MRIVLASILIFSILSFQFSELIVYAVFKLNQDYIAQNLCIEKDIEDSTCNGCCQLKKKVSEQQQNKQAVPPIQYEKLNIIFYYASNVFNLTPQGNASLYSILKPKAYEFSIFLAVFRPPKSLA